MAGSTTKTRAAAAVAAVRAPLASYFHAESSRTRPAVARLDRYFASSINIAEDLFSDTHNLLLNTILTV